MPSAPNRSMSDLMRDFNDMYGEHIRDMLIRPNPFLDMIPPSTNVGSLYSQPVVLGIEHGFTFPFGSQESVTYAYNPDLYSSRKATLEASPIVWKEMVTDKMPSIKFDEEWI